MLFLILKCLSFQSKRGIIASVEKFFKIEV